MAKLETTETELKNGGALSFRHLNGEDAVQYLNFIKQIPFDSNHTMQYIGQSYPTEVECQIKLNTAVADPTTLNIGAFVQETLVGYLNFRLVRPDHPWVSHIGQFGMMIRREFWELGIGKWLLALQDAFAKSIGVIRIEANVRVANDRGVKLYTNSGFKIEGTRRMAAKIEGIFYDEYFIAKVLSD